MALEVIVVEIWRLKIMVLLMSMELKDSDSLATSAEEERAQLKTLDESMTLLYLTDFGCVSQCRN